MKLQKITTLLIVSAFISQSSFANTQTLNTSELRERLQLSNYREEHRLKKLRSSKIYQEVYDVCKPSGYKSPMIYLKTAWNGAKNLFTATSLKYEQAYMLMTEYDGLAPQLKNWLENDGFYLALEDCYPRRDFIQGLFISGLIGYDIIGKFYGAGLTMAFYMLGGKLISLLRKAPKIFAAFKALSIAGSGLAIYKLLQLYLQNDEAAIQQMVANNNQRASNAAPELDHFVSTMISETERLLNEKILELEEKIKKPTVLSSQDLIKTEQKLQRLRIAKLDLQSVH